MTLRTSLSIGGNIVVSKTANITGATQIDGSAIAKTTLSVGGATRLKSTLSVGGATTMETTLSIGQKINFASSNGEKISFFNNVGGDDHSYGIGISNYSLFYSCEGSASSHVFKNSGDADGSGDGNKLMVIG